MEYKGRAFKGAVAGSGYLRWAKVMGLTNKFYRKAIGNKSFLEPIEVLDLGCGPGPLTFALADSLPEGSRITGIDISDDQLDYARLAAAGYPYKPEFLNRSMDELDFPDNHFDLVVTSMALHETPPQVRRRTIKEVARVLRPGGEFILVDWSKPRFGLYGILWYPMLRLGEDTRDNRNNTYPSLCAAEGLVLTEDDYLNSIYRRQVFKKQRDGH